VKDRSRFEPEASAELEHVALWYEGQRAGLGTEFLDAVDRTLESIVRWPHAAPRAIDLPDDLVVRRAPVGRFPYRVIYLEMPTGMRILAVAHDSQRPGYWHSRVLK
jgi:toxin ParE1/3/4